MAIVTRKLYEYDPTGLKPENRIINESVSVNPPTSIQDYSYFIPRATPFFADSVVIKDGKGTGARTLVENVDYWCVVDFVSASAKIGKRICSAIALLDSGYNGTLYITYQALGGNFSLDDSGVMEDLVRRRYTIRHVSYEQIINLPAAFATEEHTHVLDDFGGFDKVEEQLKLIVQHLKEKPGSWGQLAATINDHLTNKHAHTKDQVGLGNVQNYGVATDEDLIRGSNDKYLTAAHILQFNNETNSSAKAISDHLTSKNAHTAEQVGLGNVQNLPVASKSDYDNNRTGYVTTDLLKTILGTLNMTTNVPTPPATAPVTPAPASVTPTPSTPTTAPRTPTYTIRKFGMANEDNKVWIHDNNALQLSGTFKYTSDNGVIPGSVINGLKLIINAYQGSVPILSKQFNVIIDGQRGTLFSSGGRAIAGNSRGGTTHISEFPIDGLVAQANRITRFDFIFRADGVPDITMTSSGPFSVYPTNVRVVQTQNTIN